MKIMFGAVGILIVLLGLVSWYAVKKSNQVVVLKNELNIAKQVIEKMRSDHEKTIAVLQEREHKLDKIKAENEANERKLKQLSRNKPHVKKFLDQRVPDDVADFMWGPSKNKVRVPRNTRTAYKANTIASAPTRPNRDRRYGPVLQEVRSPN